LSRCTALSVTLALLPALGRFSGESLRQCDSGVSVDVPDAHERAVIYHDASAFGKSLKKPDLLEGFAEGVSGEGGMPLRMGAGVETQRAHEVTL
jgi:hypothetical protein